MNVFPKSVYMRAYIWVCVFVFLHTPPTNKPHMPEGQTSRRCCSLLGVPVALTELAESEQCRALRWADLDTDTCHTYEPQPERCRESDLHTQRANTLVETHTHTKKTSDFPRMLWQREMQSERREEMCRRETKRPILSQFFFFFFNCEIGKYMSAEKQKEANGVFLFLFHCCGASLKVPILRH